MELDILRDALKRQQEVAGILEFHQLKISVKTQQVVLLSVRSSASHSTHWLAYGWEAPTMGPLHNCTVKLSSSSELMETQLPSSQEIRLFSFLHRFPDSSCFIIHWIKDTLISGLIQINMFITGFYRKVILASWRDTFTAGHNQISLNYFQPRWDFSTSPLSLEVTAWIISKSLTAVV